jgi:hypothetical protein
VHVPPAQLGAGDVDVDGRRRNLADVEGRRRPSQCDPAGGRTGANVATEFRCQLAGPELASAECAADPVGRGLDLAPLGRVEWQPADGEHSEVGEREYVDGCPRAVGLCQPGVRPGRAWMDRSADRGTESCKAYRAASS